MKTITPNCQNDYCRQIENALNDEIAELNDENRRLQREFKFIRQRRMHFARRQAVATVAALAAVAIIALAVIISF